MLKSFFGSPIRLDGVVLDWFQTGVLQNAEKLLGSPIRLGGSRSLRQ